MSRCFQEAKEEFKVTQLRATVVLHGSIINSYNRMHINTATDHIRECRNLECSHVFPFIKIHCSIDGAYVHTECSLYGPVDSHTCESTSVSLHSEHSSGIGR